MIVEAVKRGQNVRQSGRLATSIKNNMKVAKKDGVPFKVRFSFLARGSFIHAGVGRGTSLAQAQSGNSKRNKVDWYQSVIRQDYAKFGDLWRDYWAEKMMEDLETSLDNLER